MIRFRQTEDERRYLKLRTELYLRVAQLPPKLVNEAMRTFGKLEQLLQLEGVRQGLAVAELSLLAEESGKPGVRGLKAFQAHATMYGSQDTPLVDVEQERLQSWDRPGERARAAWLDESPMRYAPQTLAEWEEEQAFLSLPDGRRVLKKGHRFEDGEEHPIHQALRDAPLDDEPVSDEDEAAIAEAWADVDAGDTSALEEDWASHDWSEEEALLGRSVDPDDAQERPDMLDRTRNQIQLMRAQGWDPENWEQLIMELHLAMRVDAAFLDIQLSTPMGRAVLAQCGVLITPGQGLFLADINERLAAAANQEEGEPNERSATEDGGPHPDGEPAPAAVLSDDDPPGPDAS